MMRRLFQIYIVFSLLLFAFNVEGQSSRGKSNAVNNSRFQIQGSVKLDEGDPSGTVVKLINLDSKQTENSISVLSSGKFDLELSFFKEYKISVSKEDYYSKEIDFSTVIPRDVWGKDSIFPPFIVPVILHKKVKDYVLSSEGKTVVKYTYNRKLDNFDYKVLINDRDVTDEINEARKSLIDKDFNQKLAEALEYEKKSDLSTAYRLYNEALKIKPSDKFVKEKIKELASELKNQGNDAKLKAEFERLMALGDANVNGLKYNDAIQFFKGALKVIPNDPSAVSKLASAEKQLAMVGDKTKKEAEFSRLMAAGDASATQLKYTEAITSFKAALDIKPGDTVALARISDAEKQLALIGDKAKKDAEFSRLMAEGDKDVKGLKYTEAITSFKAALDIKPGDTVALARISDAEKQLALIGDKAKKEAEFSRLIADGDKDVKGLKYTEAITSFKAALDIKPGDTVALARISDAEKQLALIGDKAKKDAEFSRLMAEGDKDVKGLKYTEAITSFKAALDIKPGDTVALTRISDAEKQLALIGDKAKKEAEFSRLLAEGDKNVKVLKYTEAITSFKAALDIKPGDTVALARISDAEKQLALIGDKAKKDAEFSRLIADGDKDVKGLKYTEAITSFKAALDIKPGDTVALARISDAEKQLALIGDKAKKEAEFSRLLAEGDKNVNKVHYEDAINNFNDAITIMPDNLIAKEKLTAAQQLLAKLLALNLKTEEEFNRLLTSGDVSISVKKYTEALTLYKSAYALIDNEIVKTKITETERLIQLAEAERIRLDAEKQANALKLQQYKEAIEKADQLFASKSFPESKQLYQQALAIDKVASYPVIRIREVDKIMAQLLADALVREKDSIKIKLYNEAIKIADKSYNEKNWNLALTNYTKASDIRTNEVYPKNRIKEVQNFITQENADSKFYKDAVIRGEAYFTAKHYNDAISAFKEAQKIKPSEILPPQRIKEIQSIVDGLAIKAMDNQKFAEDNKLSSNEKLFLEKVKIADESYKTSQWTVARFYYIEALKFKQSDNYSLKQVDDCDKMIDSGITAEKMQEYKSKVDKADSEMKVKNYSSAKFYYRTASDILKWETYPLQQLKEIDKIVATKLSEADQLQFTENLNKGDQAFSNGEYPTARFYYNKAIEISPSDHITSQLKEIESIVNGTDSKKNNAAYDDFIKKGDEAVKQKNSSIARFYFQKANALKPNENYPKEQLKKINSDVGSL